MDRRWSFYKDLLPILVIIGNEFVGVGLLTLFKAATLQGLNNHVYLSYALAVATSVQLPLIIFHTRSIAVPPLSLSIISKILLLGLISSTFQILGYTGISYSSPTLASSISNLSPALTFILATILRMEKLGAKRRSSQAKVMGSIISIAGAFVITFYKGLPIINEHKQLFLTPQQPSSFLNSEDASWAIGGIMLMAQYILMSIWYILMVYVLKGFPDELTIVFFVNVTATIMCTIVGLFTVPNASAWKIRLDISLISIVCSGIFGKIMGGLIYAWTLHLKGPVFLTSFQPLQIVIAVAMGVIFLDDTLYVGSIVGATIISIGLYAVLWGKATEETEEEAVISLESPTTENVPLLQSHTTETSEKKNDGFV